MKNHTEDQHLGK